MSSGTVTPSTSTTTKVTLGYRPRFINLWFKKNDNMLGVFYSEDNYPNKQVVPAKASSISFNSSSVPTTTAGRIASIDDDGFTLTAWASTTVSTYGSSGKWIAGK